MGMELTMALSDDRVPVKDCLAHTRGAQQRSSQCAAVGTNL
jgi:hypothetical protein